MVRPILDMPDQPVVVEQLQATASASFVRAKEPKWEHIADGLGMAPNGCMQENGALRIERYPNSIVLPPDHDYFDEGINDDDNNGIMAWKRLPCSVQRIGWEPRSRLLTLTRYAKSGALHDPVTIKVSSSEIPLSFTAGIVKQLSPTTGAILWPSETSRHRLRPTLKAVSHVDFKTKQVRTLDLKKLGVVVAMRGVDAPLSFVSSNSRRCFGVFSFVGPSLKCATEGDRFAMWSTVFMWKKNPGTYPHKLAPASSAKWAEQIGNGWAIEHFLSAKHILRTELVSPDGRRFAAGDRNAACQFRRNERIGGEAYARLGCRFPAGAGLGVARDVLWSLEQPVTWQDDVNVKYRLHSLLLVPRSYSKWHHRDEEWRVWTLGDREFFPYASEMQRALGGATTGRLHFALTIPTPGDPAQLVKVDLAAGTSTSLSTFAPSECPGTLTPGSPTFQRDLAVVHCISPLPGSKLNSRHHWSEVFDLARGTRWRTKRFVGGVSAAGTLLVSGARKWTSSSTGALFFVRWPKQN